MIKRYIKNIHLMLNTLKYGDKVYVENESVYYMMENGKIYECDKEDDGATCTYVDAEKFRNVVMKKNIYYYKK